jgi:hypothetical protein
LAANALHGPPLARPVILSASEITADGFTTTAGLPADWQPGDRLRLRGPLGRGFSFPPTARRLALACLADDPACLLPLAAAGLASSRAVSLFTRTPLSDADLPPYPLALEVLPLADLAASLAWADYLAIVVPLRQVDGLRGQLGLAPDRAPGPITQVYLDTAFPCGGLADCGACAVRTRRGWKMACHDGPVFDFSELKLNDDAR